MMRLLSIPFLIAMTTAFACSHHPRVDSIVSQKGDAQKGSELYQTHCVACHGEKLEGTELGVPIAERLHKRDDAYLANRMMQGLISMPDFEGVLSDDDAADLVAFLNTYRSAAK